MSTIVIYHKADFDGLFCREIAAQAMPEATLIGWDYGDPEPAVPDDTLLYILDLSVSGLMAHPNLIWIDHHKSAIEKYPATIPGCRIDGVAACRLAWQWFHNGIANEVMSDSAYLPTKDDFMQHRVSEPLAVRWAGEYDVWDRRDPDAETFQYGLRAITPAWGALLCDDPAEALDVKAAGRVAQAYQRNVDASVVTERSFKIVFAGLTFLALNTAKCNSLTFAALDKPETGHDALMGFYFDGAKWKVSLYHAAHRTDLDLSMIAAERGGGGHRGACGFVTNTFPFA